MFVSADHLNVSAGNHHVERGRGLDARPLWVRRAIRLTVGAPTWLAWELTAGGLLLCWASSYALGGESVVPPQLFFVVIVVAAVRFGWRGALVTSLASGLLAGPLLPADVGAGIAQPTSHWAVQAVFFVAIGQLVAFLASVSTISLADQLAGLRAERDILRGLSRGEFHVVYQPAVELASGRMIGFECLARWEHPDRGAISPEEFIASAEGTAAMRPLGQFVLEESCRQVALWKQDVLRDAPHCGVAINISTHQLTDPTLADQVAAVLHETGIDPAWLFLEVTETALIADLESALTPIAAIKALGVRFAIDDFGTGYSSLSYLHRLPVDAVKIDRSFIADLGKPGPAGAIAPLVIQLAAEHDITIVAEGVETSDQVRRLHELGCRFGQGFYYGPPLSADEMRTRLARDYATSTTN